LLDCIEDTRTARQSYHAGTNRGDAHAYVGGVIDSVYIFAALERPIMRQISVRQLRTYARWSSLILYKFSERDEAEE